MYKAILAALLCIVAGIAVVALMGRAPPVQCGADQVLSEAGVCTTIVDPYKSDAPNPFDQFDAQPVTVSEDQVARMNAEIRANAAEYQAKRDAQELRDQIRSDTRQAIQDAAREERVRNDDYSY